MNILVATRNRHKLIEIMAIFHAPGLILESIDDMASDLSLPVVEEDGATFEENAVKKAVTFACAVGQWAIADDSGLEVEALNGAPGIYSARYAGEPVDYEANNRKLLDNMAEVKDRKACFRCAIALSDPEGSVDVVAGRCDGNITESTCGSNGFGYDPVFRPDGYDCTFAEMSSELKNSISHRAVALRLAWQKWSGLLSG